VQAFLLSNWKKPQTKSWEMYLDKLGTGSSPHVADLTGDGVLDIVMGMGGKENYPTDTGVVALDGTNGKMLWHLPARNQMVGSAIFEDITHDGTPDVFIGGRSAELMAIDGRNGKILWNFFLIIKPSTRQIPGGLIF
jgi:outer membrane protein assembly factor BamB